MLSRVPASEFLQRLLVFYPEVARRHHSKSCRHSFLVDGRRGGIPLHRKYSKAGELFPLVSCSVFGMKAGDSSEGQDRP
jgi:hypothetical protein